MLANIDPVIRRQSVEIMTGLGRTAIYRAMSEGRFPKQIMISPKRVGWRKSDIERWLESRTKA